MLCGHSLNRTKLKGFSVPRNITRPAQCPNIKIKEKRHSLRFKLKVSQDFRVYHFTTHHKVDKVGFEPT